MSYRQWENPRSRKTVGHFSDWVITIKTTSQCLLCGVLALRKVSQRVLESNLGLCSRKSSLAESGKRSFGISAADNFLGRFIMA